MFTTRPPLAVCAYFGALALALTSWPAYARQARVETAALRRSDYLAAAEMVGAART